MAPTGSDRWKQTARGRQAGYVLLLALFWVALLVIGLSIAVPSFRTAYRRQQEELLIWRGEQYARAIGLYYRKVGRFPHTLEELEKGYNGIHFLRRAYPDPMNPKGSWRLIYLGPGGQLIGSVRWHTLAEYQAARLGLAAGAAGTPSPTGALPAGSLPLADQTAGNGSSPQPVTVGTPTGGEVVGGNLIGVASTVDRPSLKVFMGGRTYRQWEFIWSPLEGQRAVILPGATNQPAPTAGAPPTPPKSPAPPSPPF